MRCHLILFFVFFTITACLAEPPRRLPQQRRRPVQQRFQRLRQPSFGVRTHFLARQQAAATPYPAAEDLKPAVSFEPQQPELNYGPPASVYGAPAAEIPEAALQQEFIRNPEAEEIETTAVKPARLVSRLQRLQQQTQPRPQTLAKLVQQPQQPQLLQQQLLQPAQAVQPLQPAVLPVRASTAALTAAPVVSQIAAAPFAAPLTTLPFAQQQFYVLNQPFAYTAQYQSW